MEEKNLNQAEQVSKETAPKAKKQGKIKKFFKSRKAKRGSVAVAITVVFVCILVLFNMIAGMLVSRFPALEFDLTAAGSYKLQQDTVEYLSKVEKKIDIYVLSKEATFKNGLGASQGSEYVIQGYKLLKNMVASSSNLNLKFIELSSNPTFVNKYDNINWEGSSNENLILIDAGDNNYTVLTLSECFPYDQEYFSYGQFVVTGNNIEQAMITAILDVTTGDKITVDFITGSGAEESVYTPLKNLLKQNAYSVKDVNLTTEKLGEKAEIAVLYGPTVDLSDSAAEKLSNWLENDGDYGRTLIYIPYYTKVETPNIDNILDEYGMAVSDGISFCMSSSYYINSPYTFLTDYASDIYTASLKNSTIPTIVDTSRAIEITNQDNAVALLSVESSAGVIPFDVDTQKIETQSDVDKFIKDSINLAAIGSKTNEEEKSSNVAVFGSYSMFTKTFLSTTSFNNANYIVNLCNTVTDRGDMGITITSADVETPELGTITDSTTNAMYVIFTGIIPVAVLVMGLVVFIRRRNR